MNPKRLILPAFVLLALAQLFVPYKMISNQAAIAKTGTEFKFIIKHNQFNSSIRGNYLWLNFAEDRLKITDKKEWTKPELAYVLFTKDSAGFAKIKSVIKVKPGFESDWVRANARVVSNRRINRRDSTSFRLLNQSDSASLQLTYPFNKYYIEDTNRNQIDSVIRNAFTDTLKINYLKIRIKENQFLIEDLYLDNVPFRKIVEDVKKINKFSK